MTTVIGDAGPQEVGAVSTRRPAGPIGRLARACAALPAELAAQARAQLERWILWAPVAFGTGAAIYFALKVEPSLVVEVSAAAIAMAFAGVATLGGLSRGPRAGLWLLALSLLGFADGGLCTRLSAGPVLPDGLGVVEVRGRVVDIASASAERSRILIAPWRIGALAADRVPYRLRLTLRQPTDLEPGDGFVTRAILDPPPGPASPGGYDFARDAWFAGIGGVGLALKPPRFAAAPPPAWPLALECGWNRLRWRLTERLAAGLIAHGGGAAGLAAAVATSHQGWLSEADAQALRDAGLAHMLAIAGLHTAAVTGFVFAAVRLGVAAWPWLALRVSGKKLAAGAGLVATLVYLALSGAHPPARRAAITAGVAFLAILFGRRAISMRSLALAALVILALSPLAVVQPGFQMSFSATAALVAMAEIWPRHGGAIAAPWIIAWPQRLRDWAFAMLMVSLVAGLATAPFALQTFNRMAVYGLFANFAADLVASLMLMPALTLAGIGSALGLGTIWTTAPLAAVAWAAQAILAIAHLFASLPGAVTTVASAPAAALPVAFLSIITACLWRGWLRWLAAPLAASVLIWPRPPAPVAWIAADGNNAAVAVDGRAVVLKPMVRTFASQAWATHRGLIAPFDPQAEAELAFNCDRSACTPHLGVRPALGAWWSQRRLPTAETLDDLCRASEILILRAAVAPPPACAGVIVIRPKELAVGGAVEVFTDPHGGWRLSWAQAVRGRRPWSEPSTVQGEGRDGQQ